MVTLTRLEEMRERFKKLSNVEVGAPKKVAGGTLVEWHIPIEPTILPGMVALGIAKTEEEAAVFLSDLVKGAEVAMKSGMETEAVIRMMLIMGYHLGTLNHQKDVNPEVN